MNTPKRKLTVYIGRFSLFHKGHAEVLTRALKLSEKVLVIIGSADQPRRSKNPWNVAERESVIRRWYDNRSDDSWGELTIKSVRDWRYSHLKWLSTVGELISSSMPLDMQASDDIYLTGADRDSTGFYLKQFPQYKQDLVERNSEVSQFLSATSVREIYFGNTFNGSPIDDKHVDLLLHAFLPPESIDFMTRFRTTPSYDYVQSEYRVIKARREPMMEEYENPEDPALERRIKRYATISQTVDSIVFCAGHVLLIRRRRAPGKGLWALPGGYLNPNEWFYDGAIRELAEETKLRVPIGVLKGSLRFTFDLDHPFRSEINRVISKAHVFDLPETLVQMPSMPELMTNAKPRFPKTRGSDDADRARWFPVGEVIKNMSSVMFDDHHEAIEIAQNGLREKGSV